MRPDSRSASFTWQSGVQNVTRGNDNNNVRRRIQDSFEDDQSSSVPFSNERSFRNTLANLTLPSVGVQPRQAIRVGAEKISKTFREVRTTFGTLSQKLRRSTRRRVPLRNELSPRTPSTTPRTRARQLLGRTPTKLYSPFDIDSPVRTCADGSVREHQYQLRRTPLRSCQNISVHGSNRGTDGHSRHALFHKKPSPRNRQLNAGRKVFSGKDWD